MNDLVQLMTWTLKMDSKENSECCVTSTPAPEFKLHRKYRDTLILHGKSPDESEELKMEEIPSGLLLWDSVVILRVIPYSSAEYENCTESNSCCTDFFIVFYF